MIRATRKSVMKGKRTKTAAARRPQSGWVGLKGKLEWDPSFDDKAERERWVENDPRFLRRIDQARNSLQAGRGVRLEDVDGE